MLPDSGKVLEVYESEPDPPYGSDQHDGAASGASVRRLLGHDPGVLLTARAAFLAFVLSVVMWFTDSGEEALFTSLWEPSILALGDGAVLDGPATTPIPRFEARLVGTGVEVRSVGATG